MDNNQNNRQDQNNGYGGNNKNRQTLMLLLICITISLLSMGLFSNMFNNTTSRKITYDKFVEMLENGQVKSVEIKGNTITITPVSADSGKAVVEYTAVMTETEADLTERVLNAKGSVELYKTDTSAVSQVISMLLSFLIPFIIVMVFMSFMMNRMGRGGVMGVGKSKAKAYVQQDTGVTFRDVAGQDEAKESLQEVVDFLHNPGRYTAIGAKLPKGAL
ncbi:MAG: AAA family ATPase, partial [Lachnospiraceae bacterium]|nr:AAA family ATPase [Lachnospiraceae bacterium]